MMEVIQKKLSAMGRPFSDLIVRICQTKNCRWEFSILGTETATDREGTYTVNNISLLYSIC